MGRQASLMSSLLRLFEKNELLHTMGWKTQEGSLWAVNIHMFVYYVLLYLGYISNSLSTRFLLLWLPCTLVNLKREYMIDPHHGALPFTWGSALACQCYFVGLVFVWCPGLNIVFKCSIFFFTMTAFCVSCYNRYRLSTANYHQYSIAWEIVISVILIAPILSQDLLMSTEPNVPFAAGKPYILADVFLKLTRTICLYFYYEGSINKAEFKTQGSWFSPLSNTSFEAAFSHWSQTGPDSVRY